jgi:hypothetical protein
MISVKISTYIMHHSRKKGDSERRELIYMCRKRDKQVGVVNIIVNVIGL